MNPDILVRAGAPNSVDRDLMARDSIELTQYDDVVSEGHSSRSANSELKLGAQANFRNSTDNELKTFFAQPFVR